MSAPARTAGDEPVLLREDHGGIVRLTLNRPRARNALSVGVLTVLEDELGRLRDDPAARVVVIAGNGPAFSAGHDLQEIRSHRGDLPFQRDLLALCSRVMVGLTRLPQPVIARVHGIATAAGCQLVASCDLAVAADTARFATPGVNIGLFCSTPMVALSRNASPKQSMEMLLTGDMIDAPTALRFGLVNRVVPEADLDTAVAELAGKIASKSRVPLRIGKEAFYRQAELSLEEAYRFTSEVMVENLAADDAEEGISAFLEKRPPDWRDR